MSIDPDIPDADRPDDFGTEPRDSHATHELRSVVVSYDRRPDRRTIYPDELSSVERMSTWLTADDTAFVDLEANR